MKKMRLWVAVIFAVSPFYSDAADDISDLLGGKQEDIEINSSVSKEVVNSARRETVRESKEVYKPLVKVIEDVLAAPDVSENELSGCSRHLSVSISLGSWYSEAIVVRSTATPSKVSMYSEGSYMDSDRRVSLGFQTIDADSCVGGRYEFEIELTQINHFEANGRKGYSGHYDVQDGAKVCTLSMDVSGYFSGFCV